MYSLSGNRQGAGKGQDESRALVGVLLGERPSLLGWEEGACISGGGVPIGVAHPEGSPPGDPWEASGQVASPSCLEGAPLSP